MISNDSLWVWSAKYRRLVPAVDEAARERILGANTPPPDIHHPDSVLHTSTKRKRPENITVNKLSVVLCDKAYRHWKHREDKNAKRKGHKPTHLINCAKDREYMDL